MARCEIIIKRKTKVDKKVEGEKVLWSVIAWRFQVWVPKGVVERQGLDGMGSERTLLFRTLVPRCPIHRVSSDMVAGPRAYLR